MRCRLLQKKSHQPALRHWDVESIPEANPETCSSKAQISNRQQQQQQHFSVGLVERCLSRITSSQTKKQKEKTKNIMATVHPDLPFTDQYD